MNEKTVDAVAAQPVRQCAGYVITDVIHFGDEEFVIGEHPTAPNRYATWEVSHGDDYFWGHYYNTRTEAVADFLERAQSTLKYVQRREQQQKSPDRSDDIEL